jgi:hypothetical protein
MSASGSGVGTKQVATNRSNRHVVATSFILSTTLTLFPTSAKRRGCLVPTISLAVCFGKCLYSRDHIIVSLARHSGEQWMERAENKYPSCLNQNDVMNQNAKRVLTKLAKYYDYIPELADDATIAAVQSHSAWLWSHGLHQNLDHAAITSSFTMPWKHIVVYSLPKR